MSKEKQSGAHSWIQKNRGVWVKAQKQYPNPNQDAFLEGTVIDVGTNDAVVSLVQSQREFKINMNAIQKLTYGPNDVADMVDLEQLNEPQLLYNIKRRYLNDLIFTYCGPTLLIINPYAYIEKLFNDATMHQYQTLVFTDTLQYKNLTPHVFALAAFCLWQLFDNERNQSIVISGESGAGKTQNTKYCLKFLASLGKNMKQIVQDKSNMKKVNYEQIRRVQKAIKKANTKLVGIEDRILGCNEILEAFGNSKTIRNDNSSRFGKLILLLYGETAIDIRSALITSYLLEKSRIVSVSDGQRNYHVFYYFCKGTSAEQKKKYQLLEAKQYHYLNQSTTYDVKGSSDESKYAALKVEFEQYLTQQQIEGVLKIVSCVLNIGNLQFKKGETENHEECATITNQQFLKTVCDLMKLDFEKFKHALKFKTRKLGMNYVDSPLKFDEAVSLRDAFSKNLYQRTFNFLVEKLNDKIQLQKIDLQGETKQSRAQRKSIGLLDIFGFEVLGINTLQQFFINFANEKLQQLYVSYIFKEEQNQFLKEGLKQFSTDIGFQDNKPIIDLFQLYPLGIFHLINESSELNKPDEDLPSAISKNHPKNNFAVVPMSKRGHFQINHSCSPVMYNTNSFTAKNKDEFPKQLLQVVEAGNDEATKSIVLSQGDSSSQQTGGRASKKFLGSKFLNEMNKLTQELYSCDCHFVRCIKPNSKKAPKTFNSQAVLQSLRYLGVLDSIIIRKLGYIYRRPFKQFHKKFFQLQEYIFNYPARIKDMSEDDFKEQSKKFVEKYAKKEFSDKDILFGVKKILIKESALNTLELLTKEKRKMRIQMANKVKTMYKNAVFRRSINVGLARFRILKLHMRWLADETRKKIVHKKILKIQTIIRKYLWQKRIQKIKEEGTKAVTKISAYWKMKKQRKRFLMVREKTRRLQSVCRAYMHVGHFLRTQSCKKIVNQYFERVWSMIQTKKAIMIQKVWRGYKTRKLNKKAIATMKIVIALGRLSNRAKKNNLIFVFKKFQKILDLFKKPIMMLQAIVKRRNCERVYKKLRQSSLLIQKTYRKHLNKKFYLNRLWNRFKGHIAENQRNKLLEMSSLGVRNVKTQSKQIDETVGIPFKLYPNQILSRYVLLNKKEQKISLEDQDYGINEPLSFSEKNTMQSYIADFDMISDGDYNGTWMKKFSSLRQEINAKNQYPLNISLTEGFTSILSNRQKIYTFDVEGDSRKQGFGKIDIEGTPKKFQISGDSGYLLTTENKFYVWGDNKNSQLFNKNKALTLFSENTKLHGTSEFSTRGEVKYYVNKDSKVYERKQMGSTSIIQFSDRVAICSIASSYSFVHFLSTAGQVYSKGANFNGQLGLGFTSKSPVEKVTPNNYFKSKKQIIQSISVGIAHTVAKSKLGYAYSWGDNYFGQVTAQKGTDHVEHTPVPVQVQKQKCKLLQAVAGAKTSYYLLENMRIAAFGSSSCFAIEKSANGSYIQLLNETISNSKNLVPIKLNTSWTRTFSLMTVNAIDQSKCKVGTKTDVIFKYCRTIAKQWCENTIYPEYHEWMDNTLRLSDMRKFKFSSSIQPKKQKNNTGPESDLDELKILMELRKTSMLFRQGAKKKMEQLQKKLQNKPKKEWNEEDIETNKYIRQFCVTVLR